MKLLGGMLNRTERAKGTRGQLKGRDTSGSTKVEPPENELPTLAELNLTKKESVAARRIAALPSEKFEKLRTGEQTLMQVERDVREPA